MTSKYWGSFVTLWGRKPHIYSHSNFHKAHLIINMAIISFTNVPLVCVSVVINGSFGQCSMLNILKHVSILHQVEMSYFQVDLREPRYHLSCGFLLIRLTLSCRLTPSQSVSMAPHLIMVQLAVTMERTTTQGHWDLIWGQGNTQRLSHPDCHCVITKMSPSGLDV